MVTSEWRFYRKTTGKTKQKIIHSQSLVRWCLHLLPGCVLGLSEHLHHLLHPCRVLDQGQVLLRQLGHQIQELLGIREVQLWLILQRGDRTRRQRQANCEHQWYKLKNKGQLLKKSDLKLWAVIILIRICDPVMRKKVLRAGEPFAAACEQDSKYMFHKLYKHGVCFTTVSISGDMPHTSTKAFNVCLEVKNIFTFLLPSLSTRQILEVQRDRAELSV